MTGKLDLGSVHRSEVADDQEVGEKRGECCDFCSNFEHSLPSPYHRPIENYHTKLKLTSAIYSLNRTLNSQRRKQREKYILFTLGDKLTSNNTRYTNASA